MKSLIQLAMTILGALTIPVLQAQTVNMRVTVPFDFHVGKTSMPSGQYVVESRGPAIMIRASEGPARSVFVMANPDGKKQRGDTRLDFHQYGSEYFLAAVRDPSKDIGRVVPVTRHEQEIAKRVGGSLQATVLAANRPKEPGKP